MASHTTICAKSINCNNFNTNSAKLSGKVGIGTDNPTSSLHIKQTRDTDDSNSNTLDDDTSKIGDGIVLENTSGSKINLTLDDDSQSSTGGADLYIVSDNGYGVAMTTTKDTASLFNVTFTGQHRNLMNTNINASSQGLIVSSSGNFVNLDTSIYSSINESLPVVQLSNSDNDKKVFGVISNTEDNTSLKRTHTVGNISSIISKSTTNEQRFFINSLGEGGIWICNKGSTSIENGEYITSSSVTGYGMKQTLNEEFLTRYTVAKITCDCNFSLTKITKQKLKVISTTSNGVTTTAIDYDGNGNVQYENDLDEDGNIQQVYPLQTRFVNASGNLLVDETDYNTRLRAGESVYIACFVGCTYHCG